MAQPTEGLRNGCALQGALRALQTIEGVAPLLHTTLGCGPRTHWSVSALGGCGGALPHAGHPVPSTNITEKQVIFGGGSRLREQLKNTLKIIEGRLVLVVTGCAAEMVGDDTPAMVKESREQGHPVGYVAAPGFRGDVFDGYGLAAKALLRQNPYRNEQLTAPAAEQNEKRINLWGIIPGRNPYWQGQLHELARLLEANGWEANVLFGYGSNVEQWSQVPDADLNLVLSHRTLELAEWLEGEYGTPYLYRHLPVGPVETEAFLQTVSQALNAPYRTHYAEREAGRFGYFLSQWAEPYYDHGLQKTFSIVGDGEFAVGLTRFLQHTLGLIPVAVIITDQPSDEHKQLLEKALRTDLGPVATDVEIHYTQDLGEITDLLRDHPPELLFGSSLEAPVAEELEIPFIGAAYPLGHQIPLTKSYIGYEGALQLLEDIGSTVLQSQRKRDRALKHLQS